MALPDLCYASREFALRTSIIIFVLAVLIFVYSWLLSKIKKDKNAIKKNTLLMSALVILSLLFFILFYLAAPYIEAGLLGVSVESRIEVCSHPTVIPPSCSEQCPIASENCTCIQY
ncbi:hypothetical protein H0O00_00580 [Candidatus Micrarchaeota archaeon]|nr:hypothetical protein [Candidatus Micrarchaeota archaeon]